jgi:hypothetical protein
VTVSFGGVVAVTLAPETYVFVPERYFLAPSFTSYIVPRERCVDVYRRTHNFTHYRHSGDRVYNDGVPVEQVQRFVGRPVQRYQLADVTSARAARIQGNRVSIFRPQVQKANVPPPPQRPAARKAVVDAAQFQQSHPDRAARRAEAQGTGAPGAQPAPRPGPQPRTVQIPTEEKQPAAHPRSHGKVQQQEAPPPGHQVQPPPEQTERQPPPRHEKPPVQDQEKRQPHNPPPPEHPQHQVEPQQHHQQPPPPPPQQKQQQEKKKKEKQQQEEERKPPQR